ncbi:MAG: tRNA 2-thiocytidine biosynthesis protein TtcA [Desulfovibrionaceae bacterium]|nr:tRNA 2-thiocytidine biosynthesis protein TtcA [Desulfovibrionaceae bacterium]
MMSKKYTYAQEQCIRSAGKVMQKTNMLWPGARVGVACSGGVDSFVLLKVLKIRQGIVPFPFELMVLHLNPGFEPESHTPLFKWVSKEGLASHFELTDYGLVAHSNMNRSKSPCFRCAWLRRKHLFNLCQSYHLTHLALGHNADDLLATFFLNLCNNGRVQGMQMHEMFFGGSLRLIRPLLLLEKKTIATAAKQWQLPIISNACPSAATTMRRAMEAKLGILTGEAKQARASMYHALTRWQLELETPKS